MSKRITFLFFLTLIAVGCYTRKSSTVVVRNVKLTAFYRHGNLWKKEFLSTENGSRSTCFYSYTGNKTHVVVHDSLGDSTAFDEKEYYVDSVFDYDQSGVLYHAAYYRHAIPVKEIQYWPNGNRKSEFEPTGVDSSEAYLDQVILDLMYFDWELVYDGNMRSYYESGKIKSEGSIKDTIPVGIWIYYRESGEIDHCDTLR